ncbi:lachesin-like isoform X2 [Adelges cooleyi]|uniref:lachesin-like isoform X2 n=1 Tax=Adelges cooleyi TaxID=133065 RepID=UPI00217F538B|nr:lachesin-like isoform X2 [Adelges cooleyi]
MTTATTAERRYAVPPRLVSGTATLKVSLRLAMDTFRTCFSMLIWIHGFIHGIESRRPWFPEPVPNVTVIAGKDALLTCVVQDLHNFKVAWVRVNTQTILSIHHRMVTENSRITLSYNDHRTWFLHIRSVQETDRGWYMCQINTEPMTSQKGYLQVVVPPKIIEEESSGDLVVKEGSDLLLQCKAKGYPEPYIMWRREDGQNINYNGITVNVIDGEQLMIRKISRLHMGAYLCVASNGVSPVRSKRINVTVHFPPMLMISNQLEGTRKGFYAKLECHTEANPPSINYWTNERGDMIVSDYRFTDEKIRTGYVCKMILHISNVSHEDFSSYRCVAVNALGETDGVIKLYEIAKILTSNEVYFDDDNYKYDLKSTGPTDTTDEPINAVNDKTTSDLSSGYVLSHNIFLFPALLVLSALWIN